MKDYTAEEINALIAAWHRDEAHRQKLYLKYGIMRLALAEMASPLAYHLTALWETGEALLLTRPGMRIVELGVERGNSTFVFNALTEFGARHVGIDLRQPQLRHPLLYPDRFHFIQGDSREQATVEKARQSFCGEDPFVDYLFVDTDHSARCVQAELDVWGPAMRPGGVIVFHDTWMFGPKNPMLEYIETWAEFRRYEIEERSRLAHGLVIVKIKKTV